MPMKLKASQKIRDRATGNTITENYYLKCMTLNELNDYVNASNSKKKVIQKCRNELIRRNKNGKFR